MCSLHLTHPSAHTWIYTHTPLYMYSILSRDSFCFNYCLNSVWHGDNQFVALLRWYGSPGFFDSGLKLICIFWTLVCHFPPDIDSLWGSGLVSFLASQAHQHHGNLNQLVVLLAVWAGTKSCWKMKSAS